MFLPPEIVGKIIAFAGYSRRKGTFDELNLEQSEDVYSYAKIVEKEMDNGNLLLTESIRKVLTRLKRYLFKREGKPNAYYYYADWPDDVGEGYFVLNRLLTCWPRCWEYDDYLDEHEDIADQSEAMLHLEREVMKLDSDLIENVFPEGGSVWAKDGGPLVIESSTMARRELEVKLPDLNGLPSQVAVALRLEEHIDPSPHTGMEFCRELEFILTGPTAWKGSVTIRLDMDMYNGFNLRYDGGSSVYTREDDVIASQVDAIVAFVRALVAVDLPLVTRMKLRILSTYQTEKLKAEMQTRHEREGLQQLGLEFV